MAKRPKLRWSIDGTELTIGGVWVAVRLGGGNIRGWNVDLTGLPALKADATVRNPNRRYENREAAQRVAENLVRKWLEATGLKQAVQFTMPEQSTLSPLVDRPRRMQLVEDDNGS